jgi:2-polyprenyl-3-methyl-5-hydroxy-6-metoxy-1,4-benzoquinol methylase
VTITDINEDALLFARANVLLNGAAQAQVQKLDWNEENLPEPYDVIVGSEVVYDRKSYPLLVDFLKRALAPEGMIFLAKNADLHAPKFFVELTKYFEFKQTTQTLGSGEDAQQISLYAIRRKQNKVDEGN